MNDDDESIDSQTPPWLFAPKIGTVAGVLIGVGYLLLSAVVLALSRLADAWIFVMYRERFTFIGFYAFFAWAVLVCLGERQLNKRFIIALGFLYFVVGVAIWFLLAEPWPSVR
ncbi:hypothetical protein [Stieleria varia]|uniref:Uncharacterized protein n=1 Tax=Stieleria varia TaxID=2528005 RepID=A0A5C6B312_9BACT|nr:hypothetical protein [Stieleria varia]TWU04844.1 hypothetical protein Pla52n_28890 [Stieleria varia]